MGEPGRKNIVIVGGGISGCAALHYLNQKYQARPDVVITLLEQSRELGGTIASRQAAECIFETGPNGFLDSKTRTLEFIQDLGLTGELLRAEPSASLRYLCHQHHLYALPTRPRDFFSFPLLNFFEKARVLAEFFVKKGGHPAETIGAFGRRRLGGRFTEIFLDSMVSGIFAGDPEELVLGAAFPRIAQLEAEFGSLFRAQFAMARKNKTQNSTGNPRGHLTSFRDGMRTVPRRIFQKYEAQIQTGQRVDGITFERCRYHVRTIENKILIADELILATPAQVSARLTRQLNDGLALALGRVPYAPVAVIGLVYPSEALGRIPPGFGYLIPSINKSPVLGVLFEHHLFPLRMSANKAMFRVMVGGVRCSDFSRLDQSAILALAKNELNHTLGIRVEPCHIFYKNWALGIPQYTQGWQEAIESARRVLAYLPRLSLLANYIGGISFNDCVENAWQTVQRSSL